MYGTKKETKRCMIVLHASHPPKITMSLLHGQYKPLPYRVLPWNEIIEGKKFRNIIYFAIFKKKILSI